MHSLTALCFQKIRLKMFFPLSTIKKFHSEIVFVVWLRDVRSKNCLFFFFQENTSTKFLSFLLFYFPVFWLKISSSFAIIFADCHGLSCVHVRTRCYTAPFRVSLRGDGPRCVGLARKVSSRCNTDSYVFFIFSLFVFLLSFLHYHTCMWFSFPQRVPELARTETFSITNCF